MPRIEVNGCQIHYQQQGNGPDVVFIHAFTSNLSVWMLSGIMEQLSQDFRVTVYDLRGHGVSTVTPTGYRSDELALDLYQLTNRLALSPAYLVGHSYGGVIAVQTAVMFPQAVRGIILSDTYFPGLSQLEPDMGQSGPWQDLHQALHAVDIDIGAAVDFGRLFQIAAELPKEKFAELDKKLGPSNTRWLRQIAPLSRTTAACDAFTTGTLTAEKICSVEQPVVALYDEYSPFSTTCDYLKENLKRCKIEIVPDAKHLAPLQNPDVFAAMVRTHLLDMDHSFTS